MIFLLLIFALILPGCANYSSLRLPSSGAWTSETILLGPVIACQGGNLDFSEHSKECNKWPLSIPSLPHPETHIVELRSKASEQYQTDINLIVLKDVRVTYNTEIVGTIRGWKATATAGKNPEPMKP